MNVFFDKRYIQKNSWVGVALATISFAFSRLSVVIAAEAAPTELDYSQIASHKG